MEYKGYLKGTILKYITRIGLKGSTQDEKNDAGKIVWYSIRLEELLRENNNEE
jgi:hypothetical protein